MPRPSGESVGSNEPVGLMWDLKPRGPEWIRDLPPPHPRLVEWQNSINVVRDELTRLTYDRHQMRQVIDLARADPRLGQSGHPFLFSMRDWYTQTAVMTIRRQSDKQKQDVHSLRAVLDQMIENESLLTRTQIEALICSDPEMAEHLKRRPDFVDWLAGWRFVAGIGEGEFHIDGSIVRVDIAALESVSQYVRVYASKRIAHSAKRGQERAKQLTYSKIDDAIDRFHDVAIKYIALLTGAAYTDLTPTDQFDWHSIFRFPWKRSRE